MIGKWHIIIWSFASTFPSSIFTHSHFIFIHSFIRYIHLFLITIKRGRIPFSVTFFSLFDVVQILKYIFSAERWNKNQEMKMNNKCTQKWISTAIIIIIIIFTKIVMMKMMMVMIISKMITSNELWQQEKCLIKERQIDPKYLKT